MAALRSLLYLLFQIVVTVPFALLTLLLAPVPPLARFRFIARWARIMVWAARFILGIRWEVRYEAPLPATPCVVMAKHQSAWETMAVQILFPPIAFVLKKSLLSIPFFGWGLAMTSPIAIDRAAGREALKQIESQGAQRLADGFWVLIFPEGTRVEPGARGRYGIGGAWLAAHAGAPIVPMAHNAGRVWPKNALIKHPGLITVVLGAPIDTAGKTPAQLTREVETWIEARMEGL
jgi:1-acyl-sn-glycerol-3-phosphate acyltransferase